MLFRSASSSSFGSLIHIPASFMTVSNSVSFFFMIFTSFLQGTRPYLRQVLTHGSRSQDYGKFHFPSKLLRRSCHPFPSVCFHCHRRHGRVPMMCLRHMANCRERKISMKYYFAETCSTYDDDTCSCVCAFEGELKKDDIVVIDYNDHFITARIKEIGRAHV